MSKITRLLDVLIVRKITIHSFAQKRGVNRDCIKPRMKRKILEIKMMKTTLEIVGFSNAGWPLQAVLLY